MNTVEFYAAKGGQGCTTVALAFALAGVAAGKTVGFMDLSPQQDAHAAAGLAKGQTMTAGLHFGWVEGGPELDLLVVDRGTSRDVTLNATRYLVTRACYLALRAACGFAATQRTRPDGVVVVLEPGRALGTEDVADVVGAPVVAGITYDPSVARWIDAGLACTGRVAPAPLKPLRHLAERS